MDDFWKTRFIVDLGNVRVLFQISDNGWSTNDALKALRVLENKIRTIEAGGNAVGQYRKTLEEFGGTGYQQATKDIHNKFPIVMKELKDD